ncbi:MAG: LOG family protein [Phycisphaerales bacterium JB043]
MTQTDNTKRNASPAMSPHRPLGRSQLGSDEFADKLNALIGEAGGEVDHHNNRFIRELMVTALKLVTDERDRGELKLMSAAMREMRHAYRVFARHPQLKKISIFGSARTPPDHPDYQAAIEFSREMASRDWAVITGAGDGIMKAGHEGPGREASFGLAIRLPFETTANTIITGDPKLITFKYFFTRKLMFVSQSQAVAVFPGGFGTQDELFEVLTLIQTGKSSMVPIVLIEGEGGVYWKHWENYVEHSLLEGGFISSEDLNLFAIASSPQEAAELVTRFYRNYHSSRYVRKDLVLRLNSRLKDEDVEALNDEFGDLVASGRIVQRGAYDEESDHLALPRIAFHHTKHGFGRLRLMIDRINHFDPSV